MKKLLLFFLLLTLSSCNCSDSSYFIVADYISESRNRCEYRIIQGGKHQLGAQITFIDTCGKYSVGDTLIFK